MLHRIAFLALAAMLAACSATPTPTQDTAPIRQVSLPSGPQAPELAGGGSWINSEPLTLEKLRGRVVLINFWTYGCYNCQNTLPYVREWWQKYKDQDFVIIGVHTPEFAHESILENVQAAVKAEEISWPVVQDNDKIIWRAYHNNYWPRFYLIDHRGQIIYDHIGEGRYDLTEQKIADAIENAP